MRDRFATFVEVVRARASGQGDDVALRFLRTGEPDGPADVATYGQLDERARGVAAELQRLGAAGARVLLLYPHELEYVHAFLGCLYAGAVAVPAYPPDPARLERTLPRLRSIVDDAGAAFVLTTGAIGALASRVPGLDSVRWIATDELEATLAARWRPPAIDGGSLAFLQYTSGSVSEPRGVMIAHASLLDNQRRMQRVFGTGSGSVGVSWLPLYHDMGLIGAVLHPLWAGFPCTLLSPLHFLARPLRWLRAISELRATISGGPNFAYDLCARKAQPRELERLGLDSWEVAFCGAEPIRASTARAFMETFAPCGLRPGAFLPCYGLAEATLLVSGARKGEGPVVRAWDVGALGRGRLVPAATDGRELVSSGRAAGEEVVIVDAQAARRAGAGEIGEVWVRGASVARGYWGRADASRETFAARVASEGPFLRTGDLGCVVDGELFITGRAKDLILVRGRNHYPQDLELSVERCHPAVRPGCVAAFSVDVDGEERLVVVAELDDACAPSTRPAVLDAVRAAVTAQHDVSVHAVELLRARSIPKTSSGKLRRRACRQGFVEGSLDVLARSTLPPAAPEVASLDPLGEWLRAAVAASAGVDVAAVDPDRSLLELGLDSQALVELSARIEDRLGRRLPATLVEGTPTVARLLAALSTAGAGDDDPPPARAPRDQPLPLSFNQERFWYLGRHTRLEVTNGLSAAFRLRGRLAADALAAALAEVVARHEALRTSIVEVDGAPRQVVAPSVPLPLERHDLSRRPRDEQERRLRELAREQSERPFDLTRAPLCRVALVALDDETHALLVTVDHMVADAWSLAIFVRELVTLHAAFAAGEPSPLPRPSLHFPDFAAWERRRLRGGRLEGLLAHWKAALGPAPAVEPPLDRYAGARESLQVPPGLHARLAAVARREGATLFVVLLAALELALHRATGRRDLLVASPHANRDRPEARDVIGYFGDTVLVRTRLPRDAGFASVLQQVRAAVEAAHAQRALPIAKLLAELYPDAYARRSEVAPVQLNCLLGLPQRLVAPGLAVERLAGLHPDVPRFFYYDLALWASERAGGLALDVLYNTLVHPRSFAQRLLGELSTVLEGVS
jgi:acyl-CoA synthetase (AMP-forming)/AMP-acid ligase II/acyl carrier protein